MWPRYSAAAAAAAAKSLQSCPTLCDPRDSSPPGSPVPGILQARTLEWVAISSSNAWKWKVKVKSLSRVQLLATPWTAVYQAPRPWDSPGKSTGVEIQYSWHHIIYVFINPPVHGVTDHCLKDKVYFPCVHILMNYSIHKVCKSQLSSWINFHTMQLLVNRTSEIPIMFLSSNLIPLIVVHYFDF